MSFHETSTLVPEMRRSGAVMALRSMSEGRLHALSPVSRRWVIGSGESCDLVIKDPYVSTLHCVLERRDDGALLVRDKKSRNGTRVDGNAVEGAELRIGSYLQVGRTTLVAVAGRGAGPESALVQMRGHDPAFRAMIDQALRAAQTDCNVLILGETGTGKDLLARVIHEASRRSLGKFVPVNCGGIPRELVGSELFGHEKGSFTGAHAERDGYFVEAHGGTLFLDELGELPIELQPHLLRAIETRQVRRVGGASERAVDVRIIAATNRMDGLGTDASRLRVDLYHRLATVVLALPPLRERMGDLVELVEHLLAEHAPEHGLKSVSEEGWRSLLTYHWPGNIRELRHAVTRAVALGGDELGPVDFFQDVRVALRTPLLGADAQRLEPYESLLRGAMEQALATHGSIRAAASYLGMAKSTFADKAKAWGLLPRSKLRLPTGRLGAKQSARGATPPTADASQDVELSAAGMALECGEPVEARPQAAGMALECVEPVEAHPPAAGMALECVEPVEERPSERVSQRRVTATESITLAAEHDGEPANTPMPGGPGEPAHAPMPGGHGEPCGDDEPCADDEPCGDDEPGGDEPGGAGEYGELRGRRFG